MIYFYSLIVEKDKAINEGMVTGKQDHFGFYQIYTLCKLLKKQTITKEEVSKRNKLFQLMNTNTDTSLKRQILINFNLQMEKDREIISTHVDRLKKLGMTPEESFRNYDRKGLFAVMHYDYIMME